MKTYSQKRVSKRSRGFSLTECLLATFVLSIGLLVVVKLFQTSIANSIVVRNAIIASELAQEGLELVRNVRDNDFIAGGNGFSAFSAARRHCYISVNSPNLTCFTNQTGTTDYNLLYSGGQYISTSSTGSFQRYLYVTSPASQTWNIKSFVVWDGTALPVNGSTANCSIQNKCVYTEVTLANWKS